MNDFDCAVCGQHMEGIEFHPLLFCLLKKAGIHNQAQFLAASGFRLSVEQEAKLREWGWPIPSEIVEKVPA